MFHLLGQIVSRYRAVFCLGWVAIAVALFAFAPKWERVVRDGEFEFLPNEIPSREGEELFDSSFTQDLLSNSVVIVARREGRADQLLEEDTDFIQDVLEPAIWKIAAEEPDPNKERSAEGESLIRHVYTADDEKAIGPLLTSEDGKSTLVVVELAGGFYEKANWSAIHKIEALVAQRGDLVDDPSNLFRQGKIPPGLDLALSGTATVGRDMRQTSEQSARTTEMWTIVFVVLLLVVIYRAPVLAMVPLVSVFLSVHVILHLLAVLANWGWIGLFSGVEIYLTVVLYGAGVDYCMFLMARYKEELDGGAACDEAMAKAIDKVGSALAASAGTTICGIGMLAFAEFGKFREAGIAISLGLGLVLCTALTLLPAMLLMFGRWAFWPNVRSEQISATADWFASRPRLLPAGFIQGMWNRIGRLLTERPGAVWLTSVLVLLPFVVVAALSWNHLTYGLLTELPQDKPSVVGAEAVERHFPAGSTGPVTVLIKNPKLDFGDVDVIDTVGELSTRLSKHQERVGIADIRSVAFPLGLRNKKEQPKDGEGNSLGKTWIKMNEHRKSVANYVSDRGEFRDRMTKLDIVLNGSPFDRGTFEQFDQLKQLVRESLPADLKGSELHFLGPTARLSDLRDITRKDQLRIEILVICGVFVVLVALLREPKLAGYLIGTVFFSFLVTLGVTYSVFWALDPSGFPGLDWKTPVFLFTILIAVGQDYNIYLVTRIEEEQRRLGRIEGITSALSKTGSIISCCGLVMAGTFASLLFGLIGDLKQLGFALAFGVLFDTFIVRTLIVPSWLILLESGRLGNFGQWMGARQQAVASHRNTESPAGALPAAR